MPSTTPLRPRGVRRLALAAFAAGLAIAVVVVPARAEIITLKSGLVYRGTVSKDNTLVSIFDGMKQIVLRDTKIASIAEEVDSPGYEGFPIDQPLTVHAGAMPPNAFSISATPWDDKGRREFRYSYSTSPGSIKTKSMTQAINGLWPNRAQFRGVDGFWKAQVSLDQVGRDVVLAILARVDQKDQAQRLKVGQFLIQATWYGPALEELDRLERDFPDLKDTIRTVRQSVQELQAQERLSTLDRREAGRQPKAVLDGLKTFPTEGVAAATLVAVRDRLRRAEAQAEADLALAHDVRKAADALDPAARDETSAVLVEMLKALAEAPDAIRSRFEPFRKAAQAPTPASTAASATDAPFALALSGFVAGAEGATPSLERATKLLAVRNALRDYLIATSPEQRAASALSLREMEASGASAGGQPIDLETIARIARLMPPPRRDPRAEAPGVSRRLRVLEDDNPAPTEYVVLLPPEYHPLRSYPTVLALHAGNGPEKAAKWWAEQAALRGYIVIAPEYNLPGGPIDYRYTASEHAAAELALRDARRRYAIDSDRVYVGGQLLGANMAWDLALAHPDLFAGAVSISGLPAKYVFATRSNAEYVPFYVVLGDLAPAETDVILPFARSLIAKNYDFTYVEYYRRGLEDLPEQAPEAFDWMDRHVRDPSPKEFQVSAGRSCDTRHYGVVIREFLPGRTTAPEAVDPTGANLKPATVSRKTRDLANILDVSVSGARHVDVWVGPREVDFRRKFEVRINGRTYFKGDGKPDLDAFLEDLRIRGDRQQVYWMKIAV